MSLCTHFLLVLPHLFVLFEHVMNFRGRHFSNKRIEKSMEKNVLYVFYLLLLKVKQISILQHSDLKVF